MEARRPSFSNQAGFGGGGSFAGDKRYYVDYSTLNPDPVFLSWGALVAALLRR